jgi:hypothetical protein
VQIKKLFRTRRRIAATVIAASLVAGGGGIAAAYFLGTHATGTGHGKVGSPVTSAISMSEVTTGPTLVPGGTPQVFTFTVHNKKTKSLTLEATYTLDTATTTGTAVIVTNTSGTKVAGCQASWFDVTYQGGTAPTPEPFPFTLSGTGTYTLIYDLYFQTTTSTTQSACATAVPTIHVTVTKA